VLDAQSVLTSEGGQSRGYGAGKRTRGRKRHIVTDTLGLLLAVMVTSASVQDRHGGKAILEEAAARFGSLALIWADAGYANQVDDGLVTWARAAAGVVLEIVKRSDDVKGLPGPAPPLGRRADVRLAGPQPAARPRLRAPDQLLRNHDQDRDDQADDYPAGRRANPLEQPRHVISRIPNSH
jgi:hypothetical protein